MHVRMMTNRSNNHGVLVTTRLDQAPGKSIILVATRMLNCAADAQTLLMVAVKQPVCKMRHLQCITIATVMLLNASSCYTLGNEIKTSPQHGLPMLSDRNAM